MKSVAMLLLIGASCSWGYVPNPADSTPFRRADYAGMQELANQNIAPGLLTASGNIWITADSSPIAAINGALAAWNGVSTSSARFLSLQMTPLSYNGSDGIDVIVFVDDPYTESFTGGVVAFTPISAFQCPGGAPTCTNTANGTTVANGQIFDADTLFGPSVQFSTTHAPGTYDIQGVTTHELGHSMGANHTNILSATMFFSSVTQDVHAETLSADDIAFVSTTYPASAGNGYGTISGFTTLQGTPLTGAAITAVDVFTGTTVGGLSSVVDGSYSLQVPPGNYEVYVEPASNLTLYLLPNSTFVFPSSFQAGFAGGNSQPSLITVQAGSQATASLSAGAGLTPLTVPLVAIGEAGATGDYNGTYYPWVSVASGQSVDFLFTDPLSGAIAESDIQVIGAANFRTGSLRKDTVTVSGSTAPVYRFTLDIPPLTSNTSATVVFTSGSNILTRSGVLAITRPQSVNAASYLGGAVAPGEILSFFGTQLGPASPATNGGFGSNGLLPVSLGGITVSFGQNAAPLFYASGSQINLQVPYEIAGQASTPMTISYNGTEVATSTLNVAKTAPGIFVVTNADGSVNGPNSPSPVGGTLVVYGTGAGVTSGLVRTGAPAPANSTVAAAVTIGGAPVTPIFAGLTSGSVGLTQVNVAIPPGTPSGNAIPLQISIGGNPSQTVNISVQ